MNNEVEDDDKDGHGEDDGNDDPNDDSRNRLDLQALKKRNHHCRTHKSNDCQERREDVPSPIFERFQGQMCCNQAQFDDQQECDLDLRTVSGKSDDESSKNCGS